MTNFFKGNNLLITLAGFLVIALGIMAYVTYNMKPDNVITDTQTVTLMQQSEDDETESIEKDLNDTGLDDMDKELDDIDKELSSSE